MSHPLRLRSRLSRMRHCPSHPLSRRHPRSSLPQTRRHPSRRTPLLMKEQLRLLMSLVSSRPRARLASARPTLRHRPLDLPEREQARSLLVRLIRFNALAKHPPQLRARAGSITAAELLNPFNAFTTSLPLSALCFLTVQLLTSYPVRVACAIVWSLWHPVTAMIRQASAYKLPGADRVYVPERRENIVSVRIG